MVIVTLRQKIVFMRLYALIFDLKCALGLTLIAFYLKRVWTYLRIPSLSIWCLNTDCINSKGEINVLIFCNLGDIKCSLYLCRMGNEDKKGYFGILCF